MNPTEMKVLDVNGVRVHVFANGTIKIYGRTKAISDKTMDYINAEALLDGLFDNNIFKSKRPTA